MEVPFDRQADIAEGSTIAVLSNRHQHFRSRADVVPASLAISRDDGKTWTTTVV